MICRAGKVGFEPVPRSLVVMRLLRARLFVDEVGCDALHRCRKLSTRRRLASARSMPMRALVGLACTTSSDLALQASAAHRLARGLPADRSVPRRRCGAHRCARRLSRARAAALASRPARGPERGRGASRIHIVASQRTDAALQSDAFAKALPRRMRRQLDLRMPEAEVALDEAATGGDDLGEVVARPS